MKLTTIGSAAGGAQLGRDGSGHLVEIPGSNANSTWSLDAGYSLGTVDEYIRLGDLSGIVVSHGHPDHIAAFADLVVRNFWKAHPESLKAFFNGERGAFPRLSVYGPANLREILLAQLNVPGAVPTSAAEQYPGANYQLIAPAALDEVLEFISLDQVISGEVSAQLRGARLSAARVKHSVDAFAVRLDHPVFGSVGYTGDTAPTPALTELMAGVDLLLYNAPGSIRGAHGDYMHSSPAEAGQCATDCGAACLVLSHLNPLRSPNRQWDDGCHTPAQRRRAAKAAWTKAEEKAIAEARTTFAGPIQAAEPGLKFAVGHIPPATPKGPGAATNSRRSARLR